MMLNTNARWFNCYHTVENDRVHGAVEEPHSNVGIYSVDRLGLGNLTQLLECITLTGRCCIFVFPIEGQCSPTF